MRLAAIAVLVLTAAIAGCGPATKTVAGVVVAVDQVSLIEVRTFSLRTEGGEVLVFNVGDLDLSSSAFPANHLREHMALATPVAVAYSEADGQRTAVRLGDAPWLDQ